MAWLTRRCLQIREPQKQSGTNYGLLQTHRPLARGRVTQNQMWAAYESGCALVLHWIHTHTKSLCVELTSLVLSHGVDTTWCKQRHNNVTGTKDMKVALTVRYALKITSHTREDKYRQCKCKQHFWDDVISKELHVRLVKTIKNSSLCVFHFYLL